MVNLGQLDGQPAAPLSEPTTFLIRRCTELMAKELDDFTTEDLRIMLGQQLCVRHLLPRAVDLLLEDPLTCGDFYPGDLLVAVLRLPPHCLNHVPDQSRALADRLSQLDVVSDPHVSSAIAQFLDG